MDRIVCLSDPTKCLGVETLLVGDTGLFSTVDGPASSWNCFHGSVSCSPCSRAYIVPYFPPVGSYGFHSSGLGGGGDLAGGGVSFIGLSGSGSGIGSICGWGASSIGSLRSGSLVTTGFGLIYNSIKECSRLCSWLQRRGERACCNREGGLGDSGRGRGLNGSSDGDRVGDEGCTSSGARGWDSCGKADGKMTAWLLINGAGVVDGPGADEEDGEGKGK